MIMMIHGDVYFKAIRTTEKYILAHMLIGITRHDINNMGV